MSVIIQVWSAPSCQSGAVCFGALSPFVSAGGSEATGTPAGFRVTVTRDVADRTSLAEGRCLRVLSQSRGEQWWFIASVSDSDGDAGLVQITAGPLRQLLTVRGLVRSGATFAFAPGRQSVAALLSTYVLTNLADDGLSWLSLGTVDYPDTVEIGTLDRTTRAGVLDAIETQTGHTARLRALTSGGVLTGFAVDVVADIAAGTETVPLTTGASLSAVQRTRDALRAATVAVPFGANGQPMERTVWRVSAITGTAPAWVALRDPMTGNPWPIREDDQVNGLFLEQRDGTQTIIADSRASDSAVQLASVGSIAVNDVVTLIADTAGTAVTSVPSPSGLATSRGRLVGVVTTRVADVRRNYLANGTFGTWTDDTTPASYTLTNAVIGAGVVARYPRASANTNLTLQVDGAVAAGSTTISLRGAPAGLRLYSFERFTVLTDAFRVSPTVVAFDGTGRASVAIIGTTGVPYADGDAVTLNLVGNTNDGPNRPASFPTEDAGDALRFINQNTEATSVGALIRVPSGVLTVNAAAGITIASNSVTGNLGASYWPSLRLRNTGAGTTLATASSAAQAASSTAHYTLTTSAILTSNTTVAARVTAGQQGTFPTFSYLQWQGVRWLSLWVGDGGAMTANDGSESNTLWHRAQDVLASAAQGTRYQVRGVDLRRLQAENVALALGQSVRLRSEVLGLDTTAKIVKLDYDFTTDEALNLELGAVVPRLSGVTVTL